MQKSFHLFIRRHSNDWYTASVLTHPAYAVYGPALGPMRDELREVLSQELALGVIDAVKPTFFETLSQRVLEMELRAVQHDRLIHVPMRFTVLHRPIDDKDHHEVRLPALGKRFQIHREENILPWSEEIVRDFFHLSGVERLLEYQYERGARVERLDVTYHGAGRHKKARRALHQQQSPDDLVRPFSSPLNQVGVELTEEARQGRLSRVHFRDALVDELMTVLTTGQRKSALLVGPSGVGKTAIVHEIAQRIAQSRVPLRLQEVPVWHVTGGRIIAGMRFLGQWQERCRAIVEEVRSERGILYVDSLLELMMAGSSQTGLNVARFLLPFVRSGELIVVAETTPDALLLAEQLEGPFVHALRRVPVPSFTTEQATTILELHTRQLGKEHRVEFSAEAIGRSLDVLARFGDADALPGAGLALIEQMARAAPPPARGGQRHVLQPIDAVKAFSQASGFPEALIDPDQLLNIQEVRDFFESRIIGQPAVTELLVNLVTTIKASLNDPERPLGSFLFMGPTGVGKTESALTLAEYLFGDRDRLIRLDMSEYGYPGASLRLVGGAHGEGDMTRPMREQPFCVLLLDELEKADPEVFDILLQVLGEGRLTDNTGRMVRFVHAIIIMTSNLGAARKAPPRFEHGQDHEQTDLQAHYLDAATRFFRPEFINRIDYMVPFEDLGAEAVRRIARRMLDHALQREGFARRHIQVTYKDDLIDLLMTHGFNPLYGARPMKRAVDQHVLIPLSRRLVGRGEQVEGEHFELYVHQGRVAVVSNRGLGAGPAPRAEGPVTLHDTLWARHLHRLRRRLQDWEESDTARRLTQAGDSTLLKALSQSKEAVSRLEQQGGASIEALNESALADLIDAAQALDAEIAQLEWALCVATLGGGDAQTLMVESRSVHPLSLELAEELTEQLITWARHRGFRVDAGYEGDRRRLHLVGPGAEVILRELLGVVTVHGQDDAQMNLHIFNDALDSDDAVLDITLDPETLWEPHTELELNASLSALHHHLERLLLARMAWRCAQPHKSGNLSPGRPQ